MTKETVIDIFFVSFHEKVLKNRHTYFIMGMPNPMEILWFIPFVLGVRVIQGKRVQNANGNIEVEV